MWTEMKKQFGRSANVRLSPVSKGWPYRQSFSNLAGLVAVYLTVC